MQSLGIPGRAGGVWGWGEELQERSAPAHPALEGRGWLESAALIKHALCQGHAGTDTVYHFNPWTFWAQGNYLTCPIPHLLSAQFLPAGFVPTVAAPVLMKRKKNVSGKEGG